MASSFGEPFRTAALHGDRDVQGSAVHAARGDLMDGEGAAQHHAGLLAAHRQGDEMTGSRRFGDPWCCQGNNVVLTHAPVIEYLRDDLLGHQPAVASCAARN
jgi:hypothetical protein